MLLQGLFEELPRWFFNKRLILPIPHIEDITGEPHLRVLDAVDVHAIRDWPHLEYLHAFAQEDVQLVLVLCLIEIRVLDETKPSQ